MRTIKPDTDVEETETEATELGKHTVPKEPAHECKAAHIGHKACHCGRPGCGHFTRLHPKHA